MFVDEALVYLALKKNIILVNGSWQPVNQASATCGFTSEVVGGGLSLSVPFTSNCWQFEVMCNKGLAFWPP